MGKFSAIIGDLPAAQPADLKYQDKVDQKKATIRTTSKAVVDLAQAYVLKRAELDDIEAKRYAAELDKVALEQLLVESWDQGEPGWGQYGAGPNTVRLPSGAAVDVGVALDGKVEDAASFRAWCLTPPTHCFICKEPSNLHAANDHAFRAGGGLQHKLSLPWQTMSALANDFAGAAREAAAEGTTAPAMPPGLGVQARMKVKLRKGKEKDDASVEF